MDVVREFLIDEIKEVAIVDSILLQYYQSKTQVKFQNVLNDIKLSMRRYDVFGKQGQDGTVLFNFGGSCSDGIMTIDKDGLSKDIFITSVHKVGEPVGIYDNCGNKIR